MNKTTTDNINYIVEKTLNTVGKISKHYDPMISHSGFIALQTDETRSIKENSNEEKENMYVVRYQQRTNERDGLEPNDM